MTEIAIWRVLGIEPTVDRKAIRRAYRSRARELHPDLNPSADAARRFAALEEAYRAALGQSQRGAAPAAPSWEQGMHGFSFTPEPTAAPDRAASVWEVPRFDDQLDGLFSQGPAAPAASISERGADVHAQLQLTFADALRGTTSIMSVRSQQLCDACGGSGQIKTRCEICQGGGRTSEGMRCWNCQGSGQASSQPCAACSASGLQPKNEQVAVVAPPGTRQNALLRVSGAGSAGSRQRGDLIVTVAVSAHEDYSFGPGGSLVCDLPIDVATAGLGGTRTIELPDGSPYRLRIPAMVADRREIIIPGRGWPDERGRAGDVRVRLMLGFPSELNQKMVEALRAFRQATESE